MSARNKKRQIEFADTVAGRLKVARKKSGVKTDKTTRTIAKNSLKELAKARECAKALERQTDYKLRPSVWTPKSGVADEYLFQDDFPLENEIQLENEIPLEKETLVVEKENQVQNDNTVIESGEEYQVEKDAARTEGETTRDEASVREESSSFMQLDTGQYSDSKLGEVLKDYFEGRVKPVLEKRVKEEISRGMVRLDNSFRMMMQAEADGARYRLEESIEIEMEENFEKFYAETVPELRRHNDIVLQGMSKYQREFFENVKKLSEEKNMVLVYTCSLCRGKREAKFPYKLYI